MKKLLIIIGLLILGLNAGYGQDGWPDDSFFDWKRDVGAKTMSASRGVIYQVTDYGALGDGISLNTESVQKAIDDCATHGGGVVTFSTGKYLLGSIFLKKGVILDIPKGVEILGSQNIEDYPVIPTRVAGIEMNWPAALINIIDQDNVAIIGDGVINGRGKVFWDKYYQMRKEYDPKGLRWVVDYDSQRPRGILISGSTNITLKGFVLYQAGFWSVHVLYSKYVTIDGLIINNNIEGRGPSTDGVDIDSSSRILVQNCYINCNDDNFCLKAGRDADGLKVNRPCEYIVIRDCVAGHGDGLFTCGSETSGGIRNVLVYNMKGLGTKYGLRFKSTAQRGGVIENIYMSNIEMVGVRDPFVVDLNWHPTYSTSLLPEGYPMEGLPEHWLKLLEKVDPQKGLPKFRNVYFRNVSAVNASTCIKVSGLENSTIDHFVFENVSFQGKEAGTISYARDWALKGFSIKADNKLTITKTKGVDL